MRWLLLVCLIGCGGESAGTGIDINALECPPDSTLTYQNYTAMWIQDRCLRCHSGQSRPMLTSYESVMANKQDILETTVGTTEMPEDANIPLEERQLLADWFACGAPL
jgi:uncharacterized membrane protein